MKRVKEGVPVKTLDLHMCRSHPDNRAEAWLLSLREIVDDILLPEQISETRKQVETMWNIKRSHIGAAGMRSELTFERGGTVVIARVKSGEAKYIR